MSATIIAVVAGIVAIIGAASGLDAAYAKEAELSDARQIRLSRAFLWVWRGFKFSWRKSKMSPASAVSPAQRDAAAKFSGLVAAALAAAAAFLRSGDPGTRSVGIWFLAYIALLVGGGMLAGAWGLYLERRKLKVGLPSGGTTAALKTNPQQHPEEEPLHG